MSSNSSPLAFLTKKPFWYFIMMWVSLKVWLIIGAGIQAVVNYYKNGVMPSEGWSIVTYTVAFALAMVYIFVLYPRRPGFVMWLSIGISAVADAWFTYWVATSVHQHGLGLSANLIPYLGWLDVFCRSIVGPMTGAMLVLFTLLNIWLVFAILQPEKYGLEWLSIRLLPEHDSFVFSTEEFQYRVRQRPHNQFFRGVHLLRYPFMEGFRADPAMWRKLGADERSWFVGVDSTDFLPEGAPDDGVDCFMFPGHGHDTIKVGEDADVVKMMNMPVPGGLIMKIRAQLAFVSERVITGVLDTHKETREAMETLMKRIVEIFGALGTIEISEICYLVSRTTDERVDTIDLLTDIDDCTIVASHRLMDLAAKINTRYHATIVESDRVTEVIQEFERRLRNAGRLVTTVAIQDCDWANAEIKSAMTELAKASQHALAAPAMAETQAKVAETLLERVIKAIENANHGGDEAKLVGKERAALAQWFLMGKSGVMPFVTVPQPGNQAGSQHSQPSGQSSKTVVQPGQPRSGGPAPTGGGGHS